MIPDPVTDGRLLVALDDFINPKTGRKIFGCSHIFDHAAKANQSKQGVITGEVVYIDRFGNVITNISSTDIDKSIGNKTAVSMRK